jgi:hypothetical protein
MSAGTPRARCAAIVSGPTPCAARPGSNIGHQSTSTISAAKLEMTWTDCDGRGQFLEGHLTLLAENAGGRLHVASNKSR